jgi:hypothetical protein
MESVFREKNREAEWYRDPRLSNRNVHAVHVLGCFGEGLLYSFDLVLQSVLAKKCKSERGVAEMTNEVLQAYLELAMRTQEYSKSVVDHVMVSMQDLMHELSEDEAIERVKRLRHGTW